MSTKDIEKHLAELEKAKKERKRSSKAIKSQSEKAKKEGKRSVEAIKSQTEKDREEGKRSAEAINSQTKWAHPSNGGGVVAGAGVDASSLLRKPSPPSSFSLLNSSTLLPKHTFSIAFAHSTYSDLHRPAPVASIPFYNLPGQVYMTGRAKASIDQPIMLEATHHLCQDLIYIHRTVYCRLCMGLALFMDQQWCASTIFLPVFIFT